MSLISALNVCQYFSFSVKLYKNMTINNLAKLTLLAEQARRSGKRSGTAKTEAKQQEHVVACRNHEINNLFYYMKYC